MNMIFKNVKSVEIFRPPTNASAHYVVDEDSKAVGIYIEGLCISLSVTSRSHAKLIFRGLKIEWPYDD